MTSRKSFFNFDIMAESLKQTKYIMVLHTIMLFLVTSIPSYFLLQTVEKNTAVESIRGYLLMWLSGANPLVGFAAFVMPTITVIYLFSYLFKSNSVQFFNSMPYTRECMYISRFTACLVSLLLPMLFVFAVNSVLYVTMNIGEYFPYSEMLLGLFYEIVSYVSFLCVTAFAMSLSGNAFASIIVAGFLGLFYVVTTVAVSCSFGTWFENVWINFNYNPIYIFPPVTIFCKAFGIINITTGEMVYAAIYSVVLFALGLLFYVKRRAENTNKFFVYGAVGTFLKYYVSMVASLIFGMIFRALSGDGILAGYIGYILILFIVYAMLQAIFEKNVRSMFSNMKSFVIFAVVWAVVLLPLNLGILENVFFGKSFIKNSVSVDGITWKSEENVAAAKALYLGAVSDDSGKGEWRTISFVANPDNQFFEIERWVYCDSTKVTDEYERVVYSSEEYREYLENAMSLKFSGAWISYGIQSVYISPDYDKIRFLQLKEELIPLLKEEMSKYDYETCRASGKAATLNIYDEKSKKTYEIPIYSCYEKSVGFIRDNMKFSEVEAETSEITEETSEISE